MDRSKLKKRFGTKLRDPFIHISFIIISNVEGLLEQMMIIKLAKKFPTIFKEMEVSALCLDLILSQISSVSAHIYLRSILIHVYESH
jgi:hypothetical protein